jgi:ABC-type nitrate/sulfonate/bicarbonate transport system permease component
VSGTRRALSLRLAPAVLGALPFAALVGTWSLVARLGLVAPGLLPPPAAVLARCGAALVDPGFRADLAVTAWRLFAGFGLAAAVGIGLGLAGAASRTAAAVLTPVVRVLAPVPKIALYPALVLLLGFDSASKVVLVAADATFPILLATLAGARAVEPKLVWAARAAGAKPAATLLTVVLPAAAPSILTGCRVALVISCIVVFLAEMISATSGLGTVLVRAARTFQTADMFVPLVAIAALGLALSALFERLRAHLLRGFP